MRNVLIAALAASLALALPQRALAAGGEEIPYGDQVMHHIADANEFHFWGDIHIPLPILAYSFEDGRFTGMSSMFYDDGTHHDPHAGAAEGHDHDGDHDHTYGQDGEGHAAGHGPTRVINGYFLDHGELRRLADPNARAEVTTIDAVVTRPDALGHDAKFVESGGEYYAIENASALLDMTGWIDFSITKNVFTMLMAMVLFLVLFVTVRRGYDKNRGKAPSGLQSFFEPIIIFVRDDIAKEMIGPKWERYFTFLATLFFFILFNNLFGLIPLAPFGANATGNIALTLSLAVITFFVVNLSGNRDYWGHVFNMPGVPWWLKPVMALIEVIGLFVKPFTLMIRLFANISAGHIIILSLIGLIFIFGENGASVAGGAAGAAIAVPFVLVMNILELFVAFLQAFIFTLLAALYIGAAVEEHHHGEGHHADHDHQLDGAPAPVVPA